MLSLSRLEAYFHEMKPWTVVILLVCQVSVLFAQSQQDTVPPKESVIKLSRFAITHELTGASVFPTMNVEFRFLTTSNWHLDARAGFGGLFQIDPIYSNTIGLYAKYGTGSSKLNLGFGAGFYYQYGREHLDWNQWAERGFYNQHYQYFFSLGYRYEHKHGFLFGIDAYAIGSFKDDWVYLPIGETWPVYPWGGLSFGYRFPSAQLHSSWMDQRRIRTNKVAKLKKELGENVAVKKLEKREKRSMDEIDRLERESLRYLTRSALYVEGLGPGGLWSLNYEYSLPLLKNELLHLYGRTGFGVYPSRKRVGNQSVRFNVLTLPNLLGLRVMKNHRGGGVGGGIVPIFSQGQVRLGYVFNADIQIHITHGLIIGGGFNLQIDYYDPPNAINPWGAFYLGYRIRRMQKESDSPE